MALPEKPLTRREMYLAKAAGQEVTLPATDLAREELYLRAIAEGGGGGGVTPEYVAEAIAEAKADIEAEIPTKTSDLTNDSGYAAIDDTTAAQNKTYSSAKVEEKVAGEEITTTATGIDLTLSTSSGNLNALTVYGKSEVVNGSIKSAGEGYAVVRLADLTWQSMLDTSGKTFFWTPTPALSNKAYGSTAMICTKYRTVGPDRDALRQNNKAIAPYNTSSQLVAVRDDDYTTVSDFVASLGDATLCYQLADPTQGNAIAVKTDNGTGINGTMATFTTGTPLLGIPDTNIRDVIAWDGSSGEVTKNCNKVRLADLTWQYYSQYNSFVTDSISDKQPVDTSDYSKGILCNKYPAYNAWWTENTKPDKTISCTANVGIAIKDTDYTTVEDFVASLGDAELVYELATPTTTPLTPTENASIAGLRTFAPTTHAQNNAGATMTVEAYAGTANGKAVNELKQDVQSEISALKITQSDTLTLAVADWSSNQQTVTYAHDTAKRNVIDVDPSSVEEWASCSVLATAETASGITFTCKTVPENALNFRVTSMGV